MISYGRQSIDNADIQAVVSVLKGDFLTQGPAVQRFENALSKKVGAKYCVAVSSGTAALHLAVACLEIEAGRVGITSPITFVASANALLYCGLIPQFADIDPQSYTIDPVQIKAILDEKVAVIIPVHLAGQAPDMQTISLIAKHNNCYVIEDASHAIGSSYENGKSVGSCCYSDMTTFSFHPVKTITTGEGGAVTTNNKVLFERLQMLRTHGIVKDSSKLSETPSGPWYYEMQTLGYNYRMTDIQAALGISQLAKLDRFCKRRRPIVSTYNQVFANVDWLITPYLREAVHACFHLYILQIDFSMLGRSRSEVMQILKTRGVGTQVHYIPVHTQPYYKSKCGCSWGSFPKSEAYYHRALSIPLFPSMSDGDVDYVINCILGLAG